MSEIVWCLRDDSIQKSYQANLGRRAHLHHKVNPIIFCGLYFHTVFYCIVRYCNICLL